MSRQVTMVSVSHPPFFPANPVILVVEAMRLAPADLTMFHFIMYTMVLISQTLIYFRATWVFFCKSAVGGHGNMRDSEKGNKKNGE